MKGKHAFFLGKVQKEQPDGVKQVIGCFAGMHSLAEDTYITAIQSHMCFVNIRHSRKKYHITVRILKNSHFSVLQQNLFIRTAFRRCGQKIYALIRKLCKRVCAKSIKRGTHKIRWIIQMQDQSGNGKTAGSIFRDRMQGCSEHSQLTQLMDPVVHICHNRRKGCIWNLVIAGQCSGNLLSGCIASFLQIPPQKNTGFI